MTSLRLPLMSLMVISSLSHAESPFEQELKELTSTRNEAIDASTRLIDNYYEKMLVPLMKRAGAAGDVDAAVKIKAALDRLPKQAEKTLIGEWDLRTTTNYTSVITFLPKGKGLNSAGDPFEWKIIGRTLYLGDLEKRPDAFELPVKDGLLTGSNRFGNGITMTKKLPETGPSSDAAQDETQVKQKRKPASQIQRMTASWDDIRKEPAAVEVLNMKSQPLVVGQGKTAWMRVPDQLTKYRTTIFTATEPMNGAANYRVTKAGYLLVACNFDYQGNSSGEWEASRWTREQFYEHGWREATHKDLGGALVKGDNREQVVFVKRVAAGESGRLRCNKYDPPYFILCSNEPVE